MSKMPLPTRSHIRSSFRDAIYTNLNVGMVDNYFVAFLLALGMNEIIAGLGVVIPQFLGVTFQLLSIRGFFTRYSLKARLVLFLSLQAMSLIPLMVAGVFQWNSPWFLIPVLGIYWASLLSLNPPWNRLIGHTVPARFRLKFFSTRNQFSQFSVVIGMVIMGLLLDGQEKNFVLPLFVGIFCIGLGLKCLSIYEIHKNHNDFEIKIGSEPRIRFRDFIKRLKGTDQGKLTVFLFLFYVSVHFSAPYFGPFMLKKLHFSYLQFMLITASSYFGRVAMLRMLQKRAKTKHLSTILLISSLGIAFSPLLWTFSQTPAWIIGVEFLSGCSWAGFELIIVLLYYQKIDDRERTSILTYIAFFNTAGMVLGSGLGALCMKFLPSWWNGYLILFTTSTFLRLLLVLFTPQINLKAQYSELLRSKNVSQLFDLKKEKKKGEKSAYRASCT